MSPLLPALFSVTFLVSSYICIHTVCGSQNSIHSLVTVLCIVDKNQCALLFCTDRKLHNTCAQKMSVKLQLWNATALKAIGNSFSADFILILCFQRSFSSCLTITCNLFACVLQLWAAPSFLSFIALQDNSIHQQYNQISSFFSIHTDCFEHTSFYYFSSVNTLHMQSLI